MRDLTSKEVNIRQKLTVALPATIFILRDHSSLMTHLRVRTKSSESRRLEMAMDVSHSAVTSKLRLNS